MAAPAWAASGTAFSGDSASVDIAAPAGVVDKSLVIAAFFLNGDTNQNVVAPAGWFAAENTPVHVTGHWMYVYWHRAAGAESGPYAFTWDASVFREGQAHRYEGVVATGTPFDAGADDAIDAGSGDTSPAVAVTTLGDERLLVHAATNWAGGTWTPHTGFTKRQQPAVGLCTLSDKAQAAAGGSGNVTATSTNSDKRTAWLGALKPVVVNNVAGTGAAALGALSAAATGTRTVPASGAAALGGLTAAASGTRATFGTAAAALGGLTAAAEDEAAASAGQGSWYTLAAVAAEARMIAQFEAARTPEACPHCGEPLRAGPGGVLYCAYDGWQPS